MKHSSHHESWQQLGGEAIRFLINGAIATAVHFCVLHVLYVVFQFPSASVSNLVGWACGLAASYTGNRYFVFPSRRGRVADEIWKFLVLYVSLALLQGLIMLVWTDMLGRDYRIGFLFCAVVQASLAYLGNRVLIFNSKKK